MSDKKKHKHEVEEVKESKIEAAEVPAANVRGG